MILNSSRVIIAIALVSVIVSCKKDDDDEQKENQQSNPITQVSMEELVGTNGISSSVNPSGIAPLTAELSFSTQTSASSEITVLGEEPVYHNFNESSTTHNLDILGLYSDTANQVVLKVSTANNYAIDTIIIQTDSLPSFLPTITVDMKNESMMEEGMNLNTLSISVSGTLYPFPLIYDKNGDVRWYLNLENDYSGFRAPMERTSDGYLLFESKNAVKEYDMMGRETKSVPLPPGYDDSHHDVIKLPNGNYVVAVDRVGSQIMLDGNLIPTVEDCMIEINGNTGALIEEWDFREIMDVDRQDIVNLDSSAYVDWFHQNAVYYSEADDAFLVSGRNQGLIKVGRNNTLKWILAPHKGWEDAGFDASGPATTPFLLTAQNAGGVPYDSSVQIGTSNDPNFGWVWGQHAPLILPNGNILLFDNGFNRNFQTGTYSRAVEYKVDDNNRTVQEVWSYGESRGAETLSFIISDVDYLPNTGNILFAPGIVDQSSLSKIVEVTRPGGQVVFEATMKFKNERVSGGGFDLTYRAERLSLYP